MSGDFARFWAGQTVSNLGSSLSRFAIPLIVFELTGSALNLGIATAAEFLPYLLFGLVIGALADRLDRKRMMILTDIGRALAMAAIPILASLGALDVWWIYGLAFLTSVLTIFFDTGEFAAIPSLVGQEDLVRANGRIQASYSAASIAGPLLAGLLVTALPITAVLFFDALSFLVSAASLSTVGASFNVASDERKASSIREDVVEGLRYVLGHPVLRNISAMMALVNFVGSTSGAQIVLFAKERLGASDPRVALFYSAGSAGVVVLSLSAGLLRRRWTFSQVALGALMLSGMSLVAMALIREYWVALALWALGGGFGVLFNINTGSLRQAIVPNHLLGRVISIASVLAWSAIPLGTLLGGVVIERTHDVVAVFAAIGVLEVLIPLAFAFTALGHAERYLPAATPKESD